MVDTQRKLLYKKHYVFTRNGRIKYSKTVDSLGTLLQETEKRLWFVIEKYPDKALYYCKTRWKPRQRERISCYTKKRYKENEAFYSKGLKITIENRSVKEITLVSPKYKHKIYITTSSN